jgi:protein-disulfide isomerase
MIKKSLMAFAAVALLSACQPQKVSDEQVEKAVAKYIKENPGEVLAAIRGAAQAQQAGRAGQGQPGQQAAVNPEAEKAAIAKIMPKLMDASHHATIGDKNSKNIVVEFYDYNCGYCKKALDTVNKLANEDKARVILVELPVLGPTSETAARASAAVNGLAPNKFFEFHTALLTGEGRVDDAKIEAAVKAAGIDLAKFKEEVAKDKYTKIIEENRSLASQIGVRGTPSFIVNDRLIRGAQPYENFKASLKK